MLNYEIVDNKKNEWVVFIHGLGGSTKTWKKQIELFSDKYNLLLLDLPGHGTNASNIVHKVDTKRLNSGIIATMKHLGIRNAHFVGLSLGTIVIANFAVRHPSYVKKIILSGSVLKLCGIYRALVRLVNGIKKFIPYKVLYKFFAWFMMPRKNHKKSRLIFLREVVKLDKATMYAWIDYLKEALHPEKIVSQLDMLGKKVLFISGDEDHCFIEGSKQLAEKIKAASIRIIEHCGHVCTIEKSAIFNKFALSYLSS